MNCTIEETRELYSCFGRLHDIFKNKVDHNGTEATREDSLWLGSWGGGDEGKWRETTEVIPTLGWRSTALESIRNLLKESGQNPTEN
jgi:hypothetical protein